MSPPGVKTIPKLPACAPFQRFVAKLSFQLVFLFAVLMMKQSSRGYLLREWEMPCPTDWKDPELQKTCMTLGGFSKLPKMSIWVRYLDSSSLHILDMNKLMKLCSASCFQVGQRGVKRSSSNASWGSLAKRPCCLYRSEWPASQAGKTFLPLMVHFMLCQMLLGQSSFLQLLCSSLEKCEI